MARGYKIAEGYLEVTADTDKANRKVDRFFRDTDGKLRDQRGRFAKEGEAAGGAYGRNLAKSAKKETDHGLDGLGNGWSKKFLSLGKVMGGLFANKFAAIALAGLGALPNAIGALSAAVGGAINIAGAGAALAPAAIGGLVLTMLSLKTAFSGLGDALKAGLSGDMAKFAQATKDMAPAMRQAALALVQLNPLIKELKKGVQENFWGRFVADIKPLATMYLPMIAKTMANIGAGFGLAAHGIAQFLMGGETAAGMALAFDNIGEAVRNVASALPGVVGALLTIFQVGASFLPGLTSGFAGLADHFARFVQAAAANGSFQRWIQSGLTLVGQLGRALGDIIGIFQSLGRAAPSGGGLFAALAQLLDMVNRFFQSMQGQAVLTSFFAKLQALGAIVINLVSAALPGLLVLSDALVTGLGFLAPIATTVGQALAAVATAIAPVLPALGKLLGVVLTLAGGVLQGLAAELGPLIGLWAQLASGLADTLLPVITELVKEALPLAVELGMSLAEAFAPLIPVILELAKAVGEQLMRELPGFLDVAKQMLPIVADVAKQIGGALLDALVRLSPYIPALVTSFIILLKIFMVFFTIVDGTVLRALGLLITIMIEVGSAVAAFVLQIYKLPGIIASAAAAVWGFVKGAGQALYGWIVSALMWLQQLPGKVLSALMALPAMLLNFVVNRLKDVAYQAGFFIGTIIRLAIELPGKIWNALQALPGLVSGLFSSLWAMAKAQFSSGVSNVVGLAASLPGRARAALSSLWGVVTGAISSAWNAGKNLFSAGVNAVVNLAHTLPGRIKGALSGAIGWLVGIGEDIVRGLGKGISNMLGWVRDKAKEIANAAISGAKRALGIGSPSKVFRDEVGKWIPPGIQAGIEAKLPQLQDWMANTMDALATRPQVNVAAPNVNVAQPVMQPVFLVDGKEISMVVLKPDRVARANAEGTRQRSFLNTGRSTATAAA